MEFCTNCGKELTDGVYFCSKCGVRTVTGIEAGVSTPMEEVREAFSRMGQEMERAFTVANREIRRAFRTAQENMKEKSDIEPIVCPHCKAKSSAGAVYCRNCGKKLA